MPRAIIGFPTYGAHASVASVLDSLLTQEYEDYSVLAIDDCSPDDTFTILKSYALRNPRLSAERNSRRLGMIDNWNRVLDKALELYPDFEFFAWASDNDPRDPAWLSSLVHALEDNQEAIFAYSRVGIGGGSRSDAEADKWMFDSRGIEAPERRLDATVKGIRAGPMMYGLHRRKILEECGGVPRVLFSDFLFLSHLSLYGSFVQEPRVLWYRGAQRTGGSIRRQRAALFARPPILSYFPIWFQHTWWLIRWMALGRRRPTGLGRWRAMLASLRYLRNWLARFGIQPVSLVSLRAAIRGELRRTLARDKNPLLQRHLSRETYRDLRHVVRRMK